MVILLVLTILAGPRPLLILLELSVEEFTLEVAWIYSAIFYFFFYLIKFTSETFIRTLDKYFTAANLHEKNINVNKFSKIKIINFSFQTFFNLDVYMKLENIFEMP